MIRVFQEVLAPAALPRLWVFIGIVWILKLGYMGLNPYVETCGEDCRSAQTFYRTGEIPLTVKSPGFTFFNAALYSVFGVDTPAYAHALRTIQVTLGMFIALMIFCISWWLFKNSVVSWMAMVFYLGDVLSHVHHYKLHTETVFVFFFTAFLLWGVFLLVNRRGDASHFFIMGLSFALALYVRGITYYLFFPLLMGFAYHLWLHHRLRPLILFALPFVILIGGWQMRNQIVSGYSEYTWIRIDNLMNYRATGARMYKENVGMEEARRRLYAEFEAEQPDWKSLPFGEREKLREAFAKRYVMDNLGPYAESWLWGWVHMFFGVGQNFYAQHFGLQQVAERLGFRFNAKSLNYFREHHPQVFVLSIWSVLFLGLLWGGIGLAGLSALRSKAEFARTEPLTFAFFLGIILYFIAIAGLEFESRFRVQIMGILIPVSAWGWKWGRDLLTQARN